MQVLAWDSHKICGRVGDAGPGMGQPQNMWQGWKCRSWHGTATKYLAGLEMQVLAWDSHKICGRVGNAGPGMGQPQNMWQS